MNNFTVTSKNIKYKILFCFWCKITNSFVFKVFKFSKKVNLFLFCRELINFCKLNNILYFFFNLNITFNLFYFLFYRLQFFKLLTYFFKLNGQSLSIVYWKSKFDFLEFLEKDFKTYFLFILEINKKQVLKAIRSLEFHKLYLKNLKKSNGFFNLKNKFLVKKTVFNSIVQLLIFNNEVYFKNFCLVKYNRILKNISLFFNNQFFYIINNFFKKIIKFLSVIFVFKLKIFIGFLEKIKIEYAKSKEKLIQFKLTFLVLNFIKNFWKYVNLIEYCLCFLKTINFFVFEKFSYSFFFFLNQVFITFFKLSSYKYSFFCYFYNLIFSLFKLNFKTIKNLQLNNKLKFYLFYYNYRQNFIDKIKKYNKLSFFLNFLFNFSKKNIMSNKLSKFIRIFYFFYKVWKKIKNFTLKQILNFGTLSIMKFFQKFNYLFFKKKYILFRIQDLKQDAAFRKEDSKIRTLWPRNYKFRHPLNFLYPRIKKFEHIRNNIGTCIISKSKFNYFLTISDAVGKTVVTRNLGFLKFIKFKKHDAYRPKTFVKMASSVVAACSKKEIFYLNLKIYCTTHGLHVSKTINTLMRKGLSVRRVTLVKRVGYNGLRLKKPKRL